VEAAGVLTLYGLYELARGLVGADTAEANGHAHRLVALAFFVDRSTEGVTATGDRKLLDALLEVVLQPT
jgi:hypothetical protein